MNIKNNKVISLMLTILLLGFSSFAYAGCPRPSSTGHLVITFEGLMGGVRGRAHKLATSMQSSGNFEVASYGHGASTNSVIKCIKKWESKNGLLRITVMGHSWGGAKSLKLAEAMRKQGMKINDLIMLDGRYSQSGNVCDGSMKRGREYPRPRGVGKVTNFYQCGSALNGALIQGAENIEVGSKHVSVPSDPKVRAKVGYILRGFSGDRASLNNAESSFALPSVSTQSAAFALPTRRALTRERRRRTVRRAQDYGSSTGVYLCSGPGGRSYECGKEEIDAQSGID